MKKILALLFVFVLLFSIVSCGCSEENSNLDNTNDTSNTNNTNNTNNTPSAVGTYGMSGYVLNIYKDGTLYLSYNDEDMDVKGTWTQLGNTICYSVWNIDGFEWNNPFYDTVYDDGIDFLGDYYNRIESNNSSLGDNNCLGTYYMEGYTNSHIDIFPNNTLVIYDADNKLNLETYINTITYIYISANNPDYENNYAMLEIDLSDLHPNELSHFEFIHILDDSRIMYNGYKFIKNMEGTTEETTEKTTEISQTTVTETTETTKATETTETTSEKMVWIPNSGTKYHSKPSCSNMKNPSQITLSKAKQLGYEPCSRCH